jgi:hypothetical protein
MRCDRSSQQPRDFLGQGALVGLLIGPKALWCRDKGLGFARLPAACDLLGSCLAEHAPFFEIHEDRLRVYVKPSCFFCGCWHWIGLSCDRLRMRVYLVYVDCNVAQSRLVRGSN